MDEVLYFGNLVIVNHSENEINDNNCIDLSLEMWNNLYDKLMGGSESLGEEDSYSDDEDIPVELKTTGGYMKDGFVVDDDEEIEYETSDNLDDESYGDDEEEDEEEEEEEDEEESEEEESEEEESDEIYESSAGSELETEEIASITD